MERTLASDAANTFYSNDMTISPSVKPPFLQLENGLLGVFSNISDAFIGFVKDLFVPGLSISDNLKKEQRYMYLALLAIAMMIIGDILNAWDL